MTIRARRWEIGEDVNTVDITDYAQDELGDIVYVQLPEVGITVEAGDVVATNDDAEKTGWLFRVRLSDQAELGSLLTKEVYFSWFSST